MKHSYCGFGGYFFYMKKCRTCLNEKDESYFELTRKGYLMTECSKCWRQKQKEYREVHKEKNRLYKKEYQQKNKVRLNAICNRYRENNIERRKEYLKNYNERRRMLTKIRRETDPFYRAQECLRNGVGRAFASKGWGKQGKSKDLLGADFETVKKHIERQFKKGMSWDRRGEIHIDHIIPLSSAKTIDELKLLCHYTNLQPLWKIDNLKKTNKVPQVQMKLAI